MTDQLQTMLSTLNTHQLAYINLDLPDPYNGDYMLASFHLIPGGKLNILQAAAEVSAESSTWTNFAVRTETAYSKLLNAVVYDVDLEDNVVKIAYPRRLFDRKWNVQNIMTYIAGNIFGMKEAKACKLLDIWFPPVMLEQYDGPSYTLDDMRRYLNVYDRPILWTIVKPKMGLSSAEYAEVAYDFRVWGWDFVKNDEPQADQDFCPYDKMVAHIKQAMDKAVKETWQKKVHSFNVSAADYDTMIERCEMIRNAGFEPGSYAFLIDGTTAGRMAVQTLRRKYPDVFIHFHRAWHGAFTRPENPIGYTVLVLSKFARLAGASGIHTWTAGVGKMAGTPSEDITAADGILHLFKKWHTFEQSRSTIPMNDEDFMSMEALDAKNQEILIDDSRRWIKKCCPIISGGLNPTLLKPFIDLMWNTDFITTMWAGTHAHPKGTKSWATALVQACEAFKADIDIHDYAKDHIELAEAIQFFEWEKARKEAKEAELQREAEHAEQAESNV